MQSLPITIRQLFTILARRKCNVMYPYVIPLVGEPVVRCFEPGKANFSSPREAHIRHRPDKCCLFCPSISSYVFDLPTGSNVSSIENNLGRDYGRQRYHSAIDNTRLLTRIRLLMRLRDIEQHHLHKLSGNHVLAAAAKAVMGYHLSLTS